MLELFQTVIDKVNSFGNDVKEIKLEITGLKQDVAGVNQEITGLKQDVAGLKQGVAGVNQEITGLKQDVAGLKQEFVGLKQKVSGIEITLENETNKKINLMFESHQSMIGKLKRIDELDEVKDRLSNVERAVLVHTAQITDLQKA